MRIASTFFTVATILLGLEPDRTYASTEYEAVELITKHVVKYLEDRGIKEIFVDQFKGPKTSGGRLLEVLIRDRLRKEGVTILKDGLNASWTLRGQLSTDTTGENVIVAVKVDLLDGNENSKAEFKKRFREDPEVQAAILDSLPDGVENTEADALIDRLTDVLKLVPTTCDVMSKFEAEIGQKADAPASTIAEEGAKDRERLTSIRKIPGQVLKQAIQNSSFLAVAGTQVRASDKSGFGIEIRVCPTVDGPFVAVPVVDRGGRAFVNLPPGQFFQVHVFNNEKFDVGMELRMDGISTMHLQEGVPNSERQNGKWLIRAGSQGVAVRGWFINPGKVERFINKPEPDGVAASFGKPHQIGTIQALFFIARTREQGDSVFDVVFNRCYKCGLPACRLIDPESTEADSVEYFLGVSPFPLASISLLHRNPTPSAPLP
jgi:hypothetical protein